MKRRRETEKVSEIRSAIEEISMMANALKKPLVVEVNPTGGGAGGSPELLDESDFNTDVVDVDEQFAACAIVPTRPFLSICYLVLQALDKIGPTMAVLRQDIDQNIQRIELLYEVDPAVYSNLVEMLKKEKTEGIAKKGSSCSKAFVWLTRSLDFTAALLQRVWMDPGQNNMEQIVEESYNMTLKPWHGWISSAAFKVALKLVPDNKAFIDLLTEKGENSDTLKEEMQTFISLLVPYLQDVHSILRFYGLDMLKST